jgi:hypothetical protein
MARITINTRITHKGRPGEVTGIKKNPLGGLLYEITLDGGGFMDSLDITQLEREDGKKVKIAKPTVGKLILLLKKNKREYKNLKKAMEERGLENLNIEETEEYGCYVGKYEMLTVVVGKLKEIKDAKK